MRSKPGSLGFCVGILGATRKNNLFYSVIIFCTSDLNTCSVFLAWGFLPEAIFGCMPNIFRKGDTTSNIGNAILFECICCISSIFPNPKMLEAAAETTSKFLKSDSHNLKYMGIDALGRLIKNNLDITEEHQLAVIDCLEDPDDTLKRTTFEFLYKMAKSTNVEVIVDRMMEYMINITDHHYKIEIASRCNKELYPAFLKKQFRDASQALGSLHENLTFHVDYHSSIDAGSKYVQRMLLEYRGFFSLTE